MAASDDFKAEMKKCLNGQQEFSEFAGMLRKAVVHEMPALKAQADNAKTQADNTDIALQVMRMEVSKFEETNKLIVELVGKVSELTSSILVVLTENKNDRENFKRLENDLSNIAEGLRVRIKEVEDDQDDTGKLLIAIKTKQNVYITIAGALSLAVLGILAKVYIK